MLFIVSGDNWPTTRGAPLPRVVKMIFSEIGLIRPDCVIWTGDTFYGYCDTHEELEAEYQAFRADRRGERAERYICSMLCKRYSS